MRTRSTARDITPSGWLLIVTFAVAAALMMSACLDDGSSVEDEGAGTEGGGEEPVATNPAGTLSFSSSEYYAAENGERLRITVRRAGGAEGMVSVLFTTADDTALAGADYVAKDGYLHWADGDSEEKSFTVGIMNPWPADEVKEFAIALSQVQGGADIGDTSTASITIGIRTDDPCCDAAAERMTSFGGVYYGISRNPEVGGLLPDDAQLLAGITGGDDPCCGAQAARARSVGIYPFDPEDPSVNEPTPGGLMAVIARNPEPWGNGTGILHTAFVSLSGPAPDSPCCLARAARLDAVGGMMVALARQPEAQSKLESAFLEMNGPLSLGPTCTLWPRHWMSAVGPLFEAVARQPSLEGTLRTAFGKFAGPGPSAERKLECDAQTGRMEAFEGHFYAMASDLSLEPQLTQIAADLLGPVADPICDEALAAGYRSQKALYEGAIVYGSATCEYAKEIAADSMAASGMSPVESPSCEVEAARLGSLEGFYDAVEDKRENFCLGLTVEPLMAEADPSPCCEAQAARALTMPAAVRAYFSGLTEDMRNELVSRIIEPYSGLPPESPCCEAQAARARTMDEAIIPFLSLTQEEKIEFYPVLEDTFLGPAPESPCCEAKGARMEAAGSYTEICLEGMTAEQCMSTGEWDLTGIFRALNGPLVTDPDCPDQGVGWILAAGSLLKTIVLGGGVWEPVEIFFSNLAGAGPSAGFKLGCEAQAARMEAYGRIFEGLIENLDWDTANLSELLAIADDYLGPVSEPLCDEAVEEAHRSLMKLYIALAFRPDKEDAYLSIAEQMGAPLAAPSCD